MTRKSEIASHDKVCPDCEQPTLEQRVEEQTFLHGTRGQEVELHAAVPILRCASCGFAMSGAEAEEIQHEAVCRHFGLMTPAEIRELRARHGLSQQELATLTGIGIASIKRWERGALLQNESSDRLLRLIAIDPEALQRLRDIKGVPARASFEPRFQTTLPRKKYEEAEHFRLRPAA